MLGLGWGLKFNYHFQKFGFEGVSVISYIKGFILGFMSDIGLVSGDLRVEGCFSG